MYYNYFKSMKKEKKGKRVCKTHKNIIMKNWENTRKLSNEFSSNYKVKSLFFIIRKTVMIPIAFLYISINSITFFILVLLFFGLRKANKFMDNIALNWMELFYNE